jgi:uncharacterized metal-binding protein YceD (DUF177 family)
MTRPALEQCWNVPVAPQDVPETGRRFELAADEHTRASVAKVAGLAALPRLEATFEVTRRRKDGLHVVGHVSATVGQVCIVTLEPIQNEIEEAIDIVFLPDAAPAPAADRDEEEIEVPAEDEPEPLVGGVVDLGAVATEFLILGIDPYPRRPGTVFEPPPSDAAAASPFAVLAALQKERKRDDR